MAERLTLSGDAKSVYLSNDAGEIRYAATTMWDLSLVVEEATGFDSIPTIERVTAPVEPEAQGTTRDADVTPWEPDVSYVLVGAHKWVRHPNGDGGPNLWRIPPKGFETHPLTWVALVGYARTNQLPITFADGAPIATPVIDIDGNRRLITYWPDSDA